MAMKSHSGPTHPKRHLSGRLETGISGILQRFRLLLNGADTSLNSRVRVLRALSVLFLLTMFGAGGFVLLEDMHWLEAVYLSVVTISTVGYGDYTPHTAAGQLYTMLLIVTGVGAALHLISVIATDVLEGSLSDFYQRSSMMREIERQANHVIVCGYGRYGRVVVDELVREGRSVVVIEQEESLESDLNDRGLRYILGSATDDELLHEAGIKRAQALVIATSEEATSVFIALSARELNPEIRIHARGETDAGIRRLRRAGADFVNSPFQQGGMRTAASILRPSVVDFLDLSMGDSAVEIDLEEIRTDEACELIGATVAEIERQGSQIKVIAFRRKDLSVQLVPGPDSRVEPGDHLVVVGERSELSALARRALAQEP